MARRLDFQVSAPSRREKESPPVRLRQDTEPPWCRISDAEEVQKATHSGTRN